MRYLKNVDTGEVTRVDDNDDATFYRLVGERRGDGTPQYVQTGAHDPGVLDVEVPGQHPANGAEPITPGASTVTAPVVAEQAPADPASEPRSRRGARGGEST